MQIAHNMWSVIEEVNQLQQRSQAFIDIYERYVVRQEQKNQFLVEDAQQEKKPIEVEQQPEWKQNNNKIVNALPEQSEYCLSSRRVVEENIQFQPKMMNLSRIFEDISLGDDKKQKESSINVELHLESAKTIFTLGHDQNTYNLSNFSSFNNQKNAETTCFYDIKDLLQKIQEKSGKQLNKKGISSIIGQLEAALEREKEAELKQSGITKHSLKISQVQPLFTTRNAFDFQLQTRRLKQITPINNIPNQLYLFSKEQIDPSPPIHSHIQKQNKKNPQSHLNFKKKTPLMASKEIRIIRKNCPKSSLVMTYTDLKQLQNFCISNKIYGKDKEKIAKAIRECKNIVTLD